MDHGPPSIIYFDPRAAADVAVGPFDLQKPSLFDVPPTKTRDRPADPELESNIRAFLSAFPQVNVCRSAAACLSRIEAVHADHHGTPTLVAVFASPDQDRKDNVNRQARSPSPCSTPANVGPIPTNELQGLTFLRHVCQERSNNAVFNYLTTVVVLGAQEPPPTTLQANAARPDSAASTGRFTAFAHYFQAGAIDVLHGPLTPERVQCLPAHAFRTCNEFRAQSPPEGGPETRRRSWSMTQRDFKQPYPYLRESMVSGLMDRICDPDYPEKPVNTKSFNISQDRQSAVAVAIGTWGFSAHDFSDDELTYACFLILKHTLAMSELEKWRLADETLLTFILACRRVYNSFVIYHNFRHACDVLQATFFFLLSVGALPPYPAIAGIQPRSQSRLPNGIAPETYDHSKEDLQRAVDPSSRNPLSTLIRPFEAMALIISAVGHDVGHPGVNNLFLVTLNAPLAQLYNDRSVLESFHCAAFSQILRRYWPKAFDDVALRKLMINTILATDMSAHSDYVGDLDRLNAALKENKNYVEDMADNKAAETRTLLCCLIIKCADISNVARKFSVAAEWAEILTEEFAHQGKMEAELEMASCLFGGPPVQNDIAKMGASQTGFINIFGIPLFTKVAQALPSMHFTVDELQANKAEWERLMEEAKKRHAKNIGGPERTHSPHQNRRSSVIAQSQMRADPMVFGTHSSMNSPRPPKRHSAGSNSQLSQGGLPASRRASLGPTVIPSGMGTPNSASRRSSAGHAKMLLGASKLAEFQGTPGLATVASPEMTGQIDGSNYEVQPRKSNSLPMPGLAAQPEVQALLRNPPDFTLRDPATGRNIEMGSGITEAPRTGSAHSMRGRDKMPAAARVDAAEDSPMPSNRSTTSRSRRFTLKFWRKSRSLDRANGRS